MERIVCMEGGRDAGLLGLRWDIVPSAPVRWESRNAGITMLDKFHPDTHWRGAMQWS